MKTKFIAFIFLFSFISIPVQAQEEDLIFEDNFLEDLLPAETDTAAAGGESADDLISDLLSELPEFDDPVADFAESETITTSFDESSETIISDDGGDVHSSAFGQPGALPSSAQIAFSVINISQNNQDAQAVGARPGDVLRYELALRSDVEDVVDYVASVDVSSIINAVDFTDTGLGVLAGGRVSFPSYSHKAPCEQIFTFFVQVKPDCGDIKVMRVDAEGQATMVNLSCELAHTGPTERWLFMTGLLILIFGVMFGFVFKPKNQMR